MELQSSVYMQYTNPAFEEKFEKLGQEQSILMMVSGKQDGLKGKPRNTQEFEIAIVNPLSSSIQTLVDFNASIHQVVSDVAIAQKARNEFVRQIAENEAEQDSEERRLALLKANADTLEKELPRKIPASRRYLLPVLFGLIEAGLFYDLLAGSSYPRYVAAILGLLVGIVGGCGIYLGANEIHRATTIKAKRKRFIVTLIIAAAVSLALGAWRNQVYREATVLESQIALNEQHAPQSSMIPFAILTFASFLICLLFELRLCRSRVHIKKWEELDRLKTEIKAGEQNIEDFKAEHAKLQTTYAAELGLVMRKGQYASQNERRLTGLLQRLLQEYEAANIQFRLNREIPSFFGQDWSHHLTFHFSKLFTHQKHEQ